MGTNPRKINNTNTRHPAKEVLEWRRNRVLELVSKGSTLTEIAKVVGYDLSTVSRDLSFIEQQAKQNIRNYVDHKLPLEYEKTLMGINEIMRESWTAANNSDNPVEKRQWLVLAKDCYSMKLDLLTNAGVIDKAVEFVSLKKNQLSKDNDKEDEETDIQRSAKENTVREPYTTNRTF